ncbi:hypothetical protein DFH06DRAFT_123552 [Mycena polygramma]|nr:hypothetical protein DFH06DRAFT_123552 [Mycena polygramma]
MFSCLPQELVDVIVDKIYEDKDIPGLKSCSLAARTFASPARHHIFRRIEILPPRSSCNPCETFYQLLISSPHIAPLVEELYIVLVGPKSYPEERDYSQRRRATWVMDSATLSLILPLLDLKRISLTENARMIILTRGDSSLNWLRLQPKLKSALMDVFSSPKLEAVHLRGVVVDSPRDLLSLFSEATSLKEMLLSRIYFPSRMESLGSWPESRRWRPQLRSLLVSDMRTNKFCPYMANPQIGLTRVSSLTLRTGLTSMKRLLPAVRAGSGSLEHLRLWVTHYYPSSSEFEEILDLNLRTVRLVSPSVLGLLGPFFQVCPRDSRVEHIVFEGHGAELPVSRDIDLNATIESTVACLQVHSLTAVEARVRGAGSELLCQWTKELRDALPSLQQRGLLRVIEVPGQEDDADHGWE